MSPKILTAACIAAQVILLAVSFNGMSATLGWGINIESPIHFEAHERTTTAWAPVYMVCWLLAEAVVLLLSFEQVVRYREQSPWLRMPSLGGLSFTAQSAFAHRLHQALIWSILLGPLYAGGHFLRKTLDARIECGDKVVVQTWSDHFFGWPSAGRCWLDGAQAGVEAFPPLEEWAFSVSYLVVAVLSAWLIWRLSKPSLTAGRTAVVKKINQSG